MKPGDVIEDRFEVASAIAEGGMGQVFRARDRITGEDVAIKSLLDPGPTHTARFLREARLLADLRGPGVVRYFAHGVAPSGELYLVMQWLEGEDLSLRLERGPLSIDDATKLAVRLADTLGIAHQKGIVHRDVKPSNVLLAEGRLDHPVLLDFGVALEFGAPRQTRTGLVVGTPWYMAPEQARGDRNIDARADVYSLGCVLFECLTGRPPFEGEHAVAVLAKILLEDPPRLRTLLRSAPDSLDALVARLLAKSPSDRTPDGTTTARLLAECALGPVTESRMSPIPGSLTAEEQRVVHVILAAREAADPMGATMESQRSLLDLDLYRERYGVTLEKLADGSIVGAVAGQGSAQDRATRAVRVAIDLLRASGLSRVVVASGLGRILASMPVGAALDRAAALATRAQVVGENGVLLDDLTADLCKGRVSLGRPKEHWVVRGEVMATSRAEAKPLIGRDREIAELLSLRAEAADEGEVRVGLVTAAPGGGKSRLATELLAKLGELEPPPRVWEARCDELAAASPFAAVSALVCASLGVDFVDPPSRRRDRLQAFLGTLPFSDEDRERLAGFLGEIIGAPAAEPTPALRAARSDAMTMADQVRRAFTDFFAGLVGEQPLVLLVDDLQWCDRPSMKLIDSALRDLEARPIFVLALARPDVDDVLPGAFEGRAVTRIALLPLSPRASEQLVRSRLGPVASDGAVARVLDLGEGNPLFLEEMASGVREGRSPDSLSGTLLATLGARLDALPSELRHVLRAASILGQRVLTSGVAALLGEGDRRAWTAERLAELVRRDVLIRSGGSREDPEISFRHALLRDAAYATLTDEDRALGHRLAADWLSSREVGDAMVIARHAELGGMLAMAAEGYVRAAGQALEGSDFAGVKERAAMAERCGAAGVLRGELEGFVAEASFWLGELAVCATHARRAMGCVPAGAPPWFHAAGYAIAALSRLGDTSGALELTEQARAASPIPEDLEPKIVALSIAAGFLPLQGHVKLAREILDGIELQAVTIGERNPHVLGRYFRSRSLLAMSVGDLPGYLAGARRSAALFTQVGDLRNALAQRANVSHGLLEVGDYAGAAEEGRMVIDQASRMGLRNVVALARQNVGYALVHVGEVAAGLEILEQALADFTALAHKRLVGGTRIYLASAELHQAHLAEAERHAEAALLDLGTSAPALRAYALAVLARIRLATGDTPHAVESADEALAILDGLGGTDAGEIEIFGAAARSALASGREDRADAILARARDRILARAARLDPREKELFLAVGANADVLALAAKRLERIS